MKHALKMASAGRRYNMNELTLILAAMREPRLVTIRVKSDAEYRCVLLTLAPVWPVKRTS